MIDFSKLCLDSLPAESLAWALAYASVGMEIAPVAKVRNKMQFLTPRGAKDATTDPKTIKTWWRQHPHADALWAVSPDCIVIDLDFKNGRNGPRDFERLTGLVISAINTPTASSPTGGVHLYFKANGVQYGPYENVGAAGIDFCGGPKGSRGVVLPGPGNGREWKKPLTGPWAEAPQFFADWMTQRAARRQNASASPQSSFTGETRRARRKLDIACEVLAKAPAGHRDGAVGKHVPRVGSLAAAGELDHEMALDELIEAAHLNAGADSKWFDKIRRAFELGLKSPATQRTKAPKAEWLEYAIRDDLGQPLSILANVLTAIRHTPELAGALAYDELSRAAVLVAELPIVAGARLITGRPLPRQIIDADVTQLQEYLQHAGMPRIGKDAVYQAVDLHSRDFSFHRLRDWLNNLKWDGKPRLDTWLIYYLGAGDTPYHRAIGRMFLIAMVARIFEPGCKADYVLILEGPQGELKSAVCQILGGDYFSDSMPDIHSKDASQHVRGKWLIELPELSALSRGDVEAWKAFITRTVEQYREPYGRKEDVEPRQCAFMGTTNKEKYLQDETGNRRFWPAHIGERLDLDSLKQDRPQLFAESVERYRAHERWWPDREFERTHILTEQEDRFEVDAWEQKISEYLDTRTEKRVQLCDLGIHALGFLSAAQIGTADQRRIARILYRLGWGPGRDWRGRFYVPRPRKIGPDA
jgi:predicted P-loop ATPase